MISAESDVCEMSACEVFVDYGDEPDTDFDKICPEIKQEFNYKREYIVEYIEGSLSGQVALYLLKY